MQSTQTAEIMRRFNQALQEYNPAMLEDLIAPDCVMGAIQSAPDGPRPSRGDTVGGVRSDTPPAPPYHSPGRSSVPDAISAMRRAVPGFTPSGSASIANQPISAISLFGLNGFTSRKLRLT